MVRKWNERRIGNGFQRLEDRRLLAGGYALFGNALAAGDSNTYAGAAIGWERGEWLTLEQRDPSGTVISSTTSKARGGDARIRGLSIDAGYPHSTVTIKLIGEDGSSLTQSVNVVSDDSLIPQPSAPRILPGTIHTGTNYVFMEGFQEDERVDYTITYSDGVIHDTGAILRFNTDGFARDTFWASYWVPEGIATIDAVGETSGLTATVNVNVVSGYAGSPPPSNEEDPPEPTTQCNGVDPYLVVDPWMIPGDSYDADGFCFDERAYIYVVQEQLGVTEEWYEGSDGENSVGEISEGMSIDDDLLSWQPATIEARDNDDNVLATASTMMVGFIPEWTFSIGTSTATPEGDLFTFEMEDGIPLGVVDLYVIGDGNETLWQFQSRQLDDDGEGTFTYQLPGNIVDQAVDGRTLRFSHSGFTADHQITVAEGLRVSMDDNGHAEGSTISPDVRNGIGDSQVIWQLINQDTGDVEHEWGYTDTNGSGEWDGTLTIPRVLPSDSPRDVYTLRMIHGGAVIDSDVLIEAGLRAHTGNSKMREGDVFHVAISGATGNATVEMEWWDGSTLVSAFCTHSVDGSGEADYPLTTPDLVTGSEETRTLKVKVDGEEFDFDYTIYDALEPTPDPGDEQVISTVQETVNGLNSHAVDSVFSVANDIVQGNELPQAVVDELLSNQTAYQHVQAQVYAQESGLPIWQQFWHSLLGVQVANAAGPVPVVVNDPDFLLEYRAESTLVVLFHGAGQRTGVSNDDGSRPGMEAVQNRLAEVPHELTFRSGNAPWHEDTGDCEDSRTCAYATAVDDVISYIEEHSITSLVIAGYSWGGDLAVTLSNRLVADSAAGVIPQVRIIGVGVIDAVDGSGTSSGNYPAGAESVFNYFQTNGDFAGLVGDGEAIGEWDGDLPEYDGGTAHGYITQVDVGEYYDHLMIDNAFAGTLATWIKRVIDEAF